MPGYVYHTHTRVYIMIFKTVSMHASFIPFRPSDTRSERVASASSPFSLKKPSHAKCKHN